MRMPVLVFSLLLPASFVFAQSTTYPKWQNPDTAAQAESNKLLDFKNRLKALIDKAEKAQAASPQFLRDLKNLANDLNRPQLKLLLDDTFSDGDFSSNPQWQVSAGEYWIEQGWGLRSAVDPDAKPQAKTQTKNLSGEDAAAALFGQILNQALGSKKTATTATRTQVPSEAVIYTIVKISNTFSLSVNIYTGSTQGQVEVAVFQGQFKGSASSPGYRLVYQPEGRIELLRISSRGRTVIDNSLNIPALQDKKFHSLTWTRQNDGTMTVAIDDTVLLSTSDQGFRDAFSGMAIINGGGDYIFKQVRVSGT